MDATCAGIRFPRPLELRIALDLHIPEKANALLHGHFAGRPYNLLVAAFGVGVWVSSGGKRLRHLTGAMLVPYAIFSFLGGTVFDMDVRGVEPVGAALLSLLVVLATATRLWPPRSNRVTPWSSVQARSSTMTCTPRGRTCRSWAP